MAQPKTTPTKRKKIIAQGSKSKQSQKKGHKYIFVVGGVMSGVGKGIATSSIGTLLQAKGYKVNLTKVDPYLNVDAGTMNPTEHGEVFVMKSGLETDQDMGNYERFLNRDALDADYMTSGMVYRDVIMRERALGYKGKCVEAVPHIRDEIVERFERGARESKSDISVVEIGGTVGDYQNIMFIEAARALKIRHPKDVIFIMVSYLPIPNKIGEMKSRPTQHAVRQLASYGVYTDIIIARSEVDVDQRRKEKIAVSCNIPTEHVISAPDISSVYDVPLNFERDNLGKIILDCLSLKPRKNAASQKGLTEWKKFAQSVKNARAGSREVKIAIVGKYFSTGDFVLTDAYVSVLEAVKYSAYAQGVKPVIEPINALDFEPGKETPQAYATLKGFDGIIVPGGFGESGIEGKLSVIKYARENKIPYFGLCYGMQLLVIEYARNVVGLKGAHTAEINSKAQHVVIDIMPDQKAKLSAGNYGASMRLGEYPAVLKQGTIAYAAYTSAGTFDTKASTAIIHERHRHRYEVNPEYINQITTPVVTGAQNEPMQLVFSGTSPDAHLMEIAELSTKNHPFFVGTQFHPEFLARPLRPHPLFTAFIKAVIEKQKSN